MYQIAVASLDAADPLVEQTADVEDENGGKDEVVVAGPRPGSPVREIAVDEEHDSEQCLDEEPAVGGFEFGRQVFLCGFGEEGGDFVLVVAVEESLLSGRCHVWILLYVYHRIQTLTYKDEHVPTKQRMITTSIYLNYANNQQIGSIQQLLTNLIEGEPMLKC